MSIQFNRSVSIQAKQNTFASNEVGITHPYTKAFLKFCDNGDIQFMADEVTGIVLSPSKGTILLVGNVVKLLTNDNEGLRWNEKAFNAEATVYSQPALVPLKKYTGSTYAHITDYLEDD